MEVYFIPYAEQVLVYRPLRPLAFIGNRALVDYLKRRAEDPATTPLLPEVEAFLTKVGYWEADTLHPGDADRPVPRPAMAVLLMTNRCNLACTYCYAAAGSCPPADMSESLARTVIDQAARNALAVGARSFALSFHGGGEPTLNWPVLTSAVAYARSLSLPCEITIASNGMWSPGVRDYICRNFDSVTLSFDGVKTVQDAQRPQRSGDGSFECVTESIRALDASGISYGVRMTMEPAAVGQMVEGVRFLCGTTAVRAIQIELSFTTERGVYADPTSTEAARFINAFLESERVGAEHGVFVSYSGARPWVIASAFCQAPSHALIATPQGRLVTCFEATGDDHPYVREFAVGRVTPDLVEFDAAAYGRFQAAQEARRSACRDCFCFWHCCGDCASRAQVSSAPHSARCQINRGITSALIASYIGRDGGLWLGPRQSRHQPPEPRRHPRAPAA